jgi:hypothetical protein
MSDPRYRPEPEIIPPGAPEPRWENQPRGRGQARVWVWPSDPRATPLRYRRPGPLGLIMLFAAIAALGALGFFIFLGALTIAVPVVAAIVLASIIGGVLRRL